MMFRQHPPSLHGESLSSGFGRIVFVNRFFWPDHAATAQMLSDLAFHLAAGGWRVEVVTSRLGYDDAAMRLPSTAVVQQVQVHRVATPAFGRTSSGRLLDCLGFHWAARRLLARRLAPGDLVVAMTDPPLLSVSLAAIVRRHDAVLVNWLQDLFPEVAAAARFPGAVGGLLWWLKRLRDASLRTAVLNVPIGAAMAERIAAAGVPSARIAVVSNWADTGAIRPLPVRESRLRAECCADASFVVGYSGNLGRAHDWETLLDAIRRLRDRQPIRFLFIGGGSGLQALRRRAAAEGLTRVHFLPYQPRSRLADSLAAVELHLVSLAPAFESLVVPSKLYGVMAAGRPVVIVGDPNGETARLVTGAGAGVAVPTGDGAALAAAILTLSRDPERRAAMAYRARRLCEAGFSAALRLPQWDRTLRDLVAGHACAGCGRLPAVLPPAGRCRGGACGDSECVSEY